MQTWFSDISFGKAITIIVLILVLCGYAECHAKTIYIKPHEYRKKMSTPIYVKIKGEYYAAFKNVFISNNHHCFIENKVNYCVNSDRLYDYNNK